MIIDDSEFERLEGKATADAADCIAKAIDGLATTMRITAELERDEEPPTIAMPPPPKLKWTFKVYRDSAGYIDSIEATPTRI